MGTPAAELQCYNSTAMIFVLGRHSLPISRPAVTHSAPTSLYYFLCSHQPRKKTRGFSWPSGVLAFFRTPSLPVGRDTRRHSAFGIHLTHRQVIGHSKVMDALFEVEEKYPHVGASMLKTFFSQQAAAQGEEAVGGIRDYGRSMTTRTKQGRRSWKG
jgi:hypothetical protein